MHFTVKSSNAPLLILVDDINIQSCEKERFHRSLCSLSLFCTRATSIGIT